MRMISMRGWVCGFLGVLIPVVSGAESARAEDTLQLTDPKSFYEALLDVSLGNLRGGQTDASIVGLRINQPPRPFDIKALYVAHAKSPSDPVLCFKMMSRDGRYTARAKYSLNGSRESISRLEFQTRYGGALGRVDKSPDAQTYRG